MNSENSRVRCYAFAGGTSRLQQYLRLCCCHAWHPDSSVSPTLEQHLCLPNSFCHALDGVCLAPVCVCVGHGLNADELCANQSSHESSGIQHGAATWHIRIHDFDIGHHCCYGPSSCPAIVSRGSEKVTEWM